MKIQINEISFRRAVHDDAEALTRLINSVYRGEHSKRGWTTEADLLGGIRISENHINSIISDPDSVIILTEMKNVLCGCVHLQKNGTVCYLGMLSVDVDMQNSGLGRIIIEHSEQFAREQFMCTEMEMKVIGQRKELIDYYQRRGYYITGEKEFFTLGKHIGNIKVEGLYFEYLKKML